MRSTRMTTDFPVTAKLEKAKPVLKKLPAGSAISGIKNTEDRAGKLQKV